MVAEKVSKPVISVIVPVYNKGRFIERCLKSIEAQYNQTAQIIIVDDESTDGSYDTCVAYAEKNGWELYRINHGGVSKARNTGMAKAKGEYIAFLDADDELTPDAVATMEKMASENVYNVIQYCHYRSKDGAYTPDPMLERGDYKLPKTLRYWQFVTNKLFRLKFLKDNKIKFIEGMQFGEDELFVVEAFLANNGVRQSNAIIYIHNLDDQKSLCRGHLDLKKLEILEQALRDRLIKLVKESKGDQWPAGAIWLAQVIDTHYQSKTFHRFGFKTKPQGKYDIVYFVKECVINEELRYSLRSVEENFCYNDVWFYGGCPNGLRPDHMVKIKQNQPTKWQNVRMMMKEVCLNDDITDNFWLFNDDFFILNRVPEDIKPRFDGTLTSKIEQMEAIRNGEKTEWTKNLRKLRQLLQNEGKPEKCYAIHEPMLINRRKMLEVLEKFPDEPMVRALYGNWCEIGGIQEADPKFSSPGDRNVSSKITACDMISTSDESFRAGYVGRWLRDRFKDKSRFEV